MDKLRKGWEKVKLGQIMDFKNGLNFTKSDKGETIKIVGVSDFRDLFELQSTSDLDVISVSNKIKDDELLSDGDLLFVRSNGNKALIGRCLYFSNVKERLSFSGFTIRGRVTSKKVFPLYIAHLSKSEIIREAINKQGGGTNISNLSQQILNDIVVHLPPLPEQIKIAEILSAWDNAIQTAEKQLTNSQQQKKALMQMLLNGEKRVAGFSGEWKNYILEHLGNTFTGLTGKSKNNFGKGKPYITYMNVFKNINIKLNEVELVEIFDDEKQNPIQYGDIFFTTSSETAEEVGMSSVLLDKPLSDVYLNSFCFGFRLHNFDILLPEYAQFLFRSEQVRKQIRILAQGATRYNLSKTKLMKLNIELPVIQEQQKIAEILTTADQEIDTLQKKLDCLKLEKRALMQKLL